MQLKIKFNKGIRFLLYVAIDIFSKYVWVIPLKEKKGFTITNYIQEILDASSCKANKSSVDKGSEFHNRSVISWLQGNNIEMYSTYNKEEFVVAERFFRTLENKI